MHFQEHKSGDQQPRNLDQAICHTLFGSKYKTEIVPLSLESYGKLCMSLNVKDDVNCNDWRMLLDDLNKNDMQTILNFEQIEGRAAKILNLYFCHFGGTEAVKRLRHLFENRGFPAGLQIIDDDITSASGESHGNNNVTVFKKPKQETVMPCNNSANPLFQKI